MQGLTNTLIYAVADLRAQGGPRHGARHAAHPRDPRPRTYLRSVVFFPVLVSTIGVGLTFQVLIDPSDGVINKALAVVGIARARAG